MYPRDMSRSQAVRTGFSAAFRRPIIFAAELSWRWAFGAAAWMLIAYSFLLLLSSFPVTDRDLFGLSGIIPSQHQAALGHIFHGSGPKLTRLVVVMIAGLSFLWWMASSFGRTVVLRELVPTARQTSLASFRSILEFNFLRTVLFIVSFFAYVGCVVLAWHVALPNDGSKIVEADVGTFYLVFIPLAVLIGWLWSSINWQLSLAPILSLNHGTGFIASTVESIALVTKRASQFTWVGFVFGLVRLLLAVVAISFGLTFMGVLAQISAGLAFVGLFISLLAYFAVADFLAIARMAAYVRIIEWDAQHQI